MVAPNYHYPDFIEIDYGSPIDLSTNTVFKIKVKTEISGELRVMMDGGSSEPVVQSQNVNGDNGWGIYIFDFSWVNSISSWGALC